MCSGSVSNSSSIGFTGGIRCGSVAARVTLAMELTTFQARMGAAHVILRSFIGLGRWPPSIPNLAKILQIAQLQFILCVAQPPQAA
jgi:hypothetical protein